MLMTSSGGGFRLTTVYLYIIYIFFILTKFTVRPADLWSVLSVIKDNYPNTEHTWLNNSWHVLLVKLGNFLILVCHENIPSLGRGKNPAWIVKINSHLTETGDERGDTVSNDFIKCYSLSVSSFALRRECWDAGRVQQQRGGVQLPGGVQSERPGSAGVCWWQEMEWEQSGVSRDCEWPTCRHQLHHHLQSATPHHQHPAHHHTIIERH